MLRAIVIKLLLLSDIAHKAVALAGNGSDKTLLLTAVVYSATDGIYPGRHRPIGNSSALPYSLDQILVADHTFAIDNQEFQNIENLGLYGDGLGATTQLSSVGIKTEIFKPVDQSSACLPFVPAKSKKSEGEIKPISRTPFSPAGMG